MAAKASKLSLEIRKVTVFADRMRAEIYCAPAYRTTTPQIAQATLSRRPNLVRHSCVNSKGHTFAAVIGNTPVPHLFEHVVVDVLVEKSNAQLPDTVFVGTSEWVNREKGLARVEVSFIDDLETLAAFKEAQKMLNDIFEIMTAL